MSRSPLVAIFPTVCPYCITNRCRLQKQHAAWRAGNDVRSVALMYGVGWMLSTVRDAQKGEWQLQVIIIWDCPFKKVVVRIWSPRSKCWDLYRLPHDEQVEVQQEMAEEVSSAPNLGHGAQRRRQTL